MSLEAKDKFKKVETYTYYGDSEDEPIEVFLIGVDAERIGQDNTFEPKAFNRHHITTWMRKRYFFLSGTVYAQVPRRTKHYPAEAKSQLGFGDIFATDITQEEDGTINVYYPVNEQKCVCINWDIGEDYWSMAVVEQPSSDGNIIQTEGHAEGSEAIWSTP